MLHLITPPPLPNTMKPYQTIRKGGGPPPISRCYITPKNCNIDLGGICYIFGCAYTCLYVPCFSSYVCPLFFLYMRSLFHLKFIIFSAYCRIEYIDNVSNSMWSRWYVVLCRFQKIFFFWLGTVEHSCTLFWKTDENNKHQQRYFTLFHVVPSEGGAECPLNFSKTKQCIELQEV